jgi:hypothetical protein
MSVQSFLLGNWTVEGPKKAFLCQNMTVSEQYGKVKLENDWTKCTKKRK